MAHLLGEVSHRRALALSGCIMAAGFSFTPFIPSYLQFNGGLDASGLALVYLVGGGAALGSVVFIGRCSDHFGALTTFRVLALLAIPVMLGMALLEPLLQMLGGPPQHIGLVPASMIVALLFVTVNGRMVAGTALVTAAAREGQRGAFLALNSTVQSAAIGVSTLVGAMLIGRNADGSLTHAWCAAMAAAVASTLSIWLAARVHAVSHSTQSHHLST